MRKAFLIICITILPVALIISCSKSGSGDDGNGGTAVNCNGVSKKFTTDVNPIIQTFCNQAACHNPGSTNGPGPLTNYTEVFNARILIREAVRSGLMPQNTTFSAAQKNTIICWIDSGAPND